MRLSSADSRNSPTIRPSVKNLSRKLRAYAGAYNGAPLEDRRFGKDGWDWADSQAFLHTAAQIARANDKRKRQLRKPTDEARQRYQENLEARHGLNAPAIQDLIDRKVTERRMSQRLVVERARDGYQSGWTGPIYRGLISDRHPILQFFSTKVNQAGYSKVRPLLQTGNSKAVVNANTHKVLGLDDRYVCWNKEMRGVLRVDVDKDFQGGFPELLTAMAALGVPAPNFAVGEIKNGALLHPHIYWILQDSVCWTSNGRQVPKRLFQTIEAALTYKLIPIGADPGGLRNAVRGKNPLSPEWTTAVMVEVPYRLSRMSAKSGGDPFGLPVLAEALGISVVKTGDELMDNAWALRRQVCLPDANDPRNSSNQMFGTIRAYVSTLLRRRRAPDSHQAINDPVKLESLRSSCEREVEACVPVWSERNNTPILEVHEMAMKTFDHLWHTFDPTKIALDTRTARGRLRAQCHGLNLAERQALGGRDVAARRREASVQKLANAFAAAQQGRGGDLPLSKLAIAAGVSRSTAYEIGYLTIRAEAAKLARPQVQATAKRTVKNSSEPSLFVFGDESPTQCLVKRGISSTVDSRTAEDETKHEKHTNDPVNSTAVSLAKQTIQQNSVPLSLPPSRSTQRYLERRAAADHRVKSTVLNRGKYQNIQSNMFASQDHIQVAGPALYHYLSAQTAGTVKLVARCHSY